MALLVFDAGALFLLFSTLIINFALNMKCNREEYALNEFAQSNIISRVSIAPRTPMKQLKIYHRFLH